MMMLALAPPNVRYNVKWIRYSNKRFVAIGFIALALSFYSLLMSTALTLASILTTALFLPNPELRNKIASESQRNEDDGMFTTLFFA
jgi:hypothetical protein